MDFLRELYEFAEVYAEKRNLRIDFGDRLGFGQHGAVWRSSRRTAIKACRLRQAYENERDAYLRLRDQGIYRIGPFDIPRPANVRPRG